MVIANSCSMTPHDKWTIPQSFAFGACGIALLFALITRVEASQPTGIADTFCKTAIHAEERRSGIPKRLLEAIASVESGRWDQASKANIAWPWTVTAEGEGKFYPSRGAAIEAVEMLQRRGIVNIDVGCMQVNLGYHPQAFDSLTQAFDPVSNVAYAAKFLKELRLQRRSWDKAVRYYHSSDPERQRYYRGKVYKARRAIQLQDVKQRRNQRIALVASRRSASQRAATGDAKPTQGKARLSYWPPRDYRAQRRLELRARNWAFNKRR